MKYNKITNEELSLLKNEISNNSSFSEIGRKLGYNIIYISEDDLKNKKEEIVKNILKMLIKNILI